MELSLGEFTNRPGTVAYVELSLGEFTDRPGTVAYVELSLGGLTNRYVLKQGLHSLIWRLNQIK